MLRAFATHGVSLVWACLTVRQEPCITVGPKAAAIEHVILTDSSVLTVPAGMLPVGR